MRGTRILLIDDDEKLGLTLERMLQDSGFDVNVARTGEEGLRLLEAAPFDVILSDIIMPDLDGIETIITLRRTYPAARIIAMSGGGRTRNMEVLSVAADIGANATIAKPFTLRVLLDTIEKVLRVT